LRSDLATKRKSQASQDSKQRNTFQTAFDFFCWKWFLDGMEGDEPMVTTPSFDVTPFGTSVFIPGYWSFSPKRDVNWEELKVVHESRGVVKRQGAAFEANRRDRQTKERLVLEAEEESRRLGETPSQRHERILQTLHNHGLGGSRETERSQTNRLPKDARRNRDGRP
jgi:hypothetical protein